MSEKADTTGNLGPLDFRIVPLDEVPIGAVVISNAKTVAARFDETQGVILGAARPFPWSTLQEPVAVLWHEGDGAPPSEWSRFATAVHDVPMIDLGTTASIDPLKAECLPGDLGSGKGYSMKTERVEGKGS